MTRIILNGKEPRALGAEDPIERDAIISPTAKLDVVIESLDEALSLMETRLVVQNPIHSIEEMLDTISSPFPEPKEVNDLTTYFGDTIQFDLHEGEILSKVLERCV